MAPGNKFTPKPRVLTKDETPATYETWREVLLFNLAMDGSFDEILEDGFSWGSMSLQNRGLTATVDGATAKQKATSLQFLLGTLQTLLLL